MDHDRWSEWALVCPADATFDSAEMQVFDVPTGHRKLVITVETDDEITGRPRCGAREF